MNAKTTKRNVKTFGNRPAADRRPSECIGLCFQNETGHDINDAMKNVTKMEAGHNSFEYTVLSNQLIFNNIMRYLSYNDVQRLSTCCQAFRFLSSFELERRKIGTTTNFILFCSQVLQSEPVYRHRKCTESAIVHIGISTAQQEITKQINQLHSRPTIALVFTGNSEPHQRFTSAFKSQLPRNCMLVNVHSKYSICGSINKHVYEVRHDREHEIGGLAYLLFGAQSQTYNIKLFIDKKNIKGMDLESITNGTICDNPIKCILYFSKYRSPRNLAKILSVCKQANNDLSIAFGGLVVDSLFSSGSPYTLGIESAGLVFTGSHVYAASAIIKDMNDEKIRDAMIHFRDSIDFDITDKTKITICFLLSCIEHSPTINYTSEYTGSESDIFHTIFPSNVKAFGLSGHGEFGQISGLQEHQKDIAHKFSCAMVLVQFPKK